MIQHEDVVYQGQLLQYQFSVDEEEGVPPQHASPYPLLGTIADRGGEACSHLDYWDFATYAAWNHISSDWLTLSDQDFIERFRTQSDPDATLLGTRDMAIP